MGELAYAADELLSRSFGKLACSVSKPETTPDEMLRNLDAFGEAMDRVGDRLARVQSFYRQLRMEADGELAAPAMSDFSFEEEVWLPLLARAY